MNTYQVHNPGFDRLIRESFARQSVMETIGAALERVEPGVVEISLVAGEHIAQQHGFVHAGILATIADSACGYAALTLMPAGSGVLSVEFKINMLRPARGPRVLARAGVVRPGSTLSACHAEVFSGTEDERTLVATMYGTMMRIESRRGIEG